MSSELMPSEKTLHRAMRMFQTLGQYSANRGDPEALAAEMAELAVLDSDQNPKPCALRTADAILRLSEDMKTRGM